MIYLDHHADHAVDSRVLEVMLPFFTDLYGNASSRTHQAGWVAHDAVERARKQVAALMGADAREVLHERRDRSESPGGCRVAAATNRRHVVTLVTEHKAVLEPVRRLATEGWSVTELTVPSTGLVDPAEVGAAITPATALVSVMLAHNEIGVIEPVAEISRLAHHHGALVHTDAVQALGKLPLDVHAMGVDLASFSAHKGAGRRAPARCSSRAVSRADAPGRNRWRARARSSRRHAERPRYRGIRRRVCGGRDRAPRRE